MKFEQPEETFVWPPKAMLIYAHRVGPKCIVKLIPSEDGFWWEMGGKQIEENESDAHDSQEVDTIYGDEDEILHDFDDSHIAPEGGVGIDRKQSRIYYRFNTRTQKHECRILLPSDFHFRSSKKGMVKKRSKSFMDDGIPRPEVLLLYALKTQELIDRRIAVEAFPEGIWNAQTYGKLFGAMEKASIKHQNFCDFAGDILSRAASRPGGLADWAVWEKVADAAFAAKKDSVLHLEDIKNQNTHVQFLRFLEEAVKEYRGIPAQVHVRDKFNWKFADSDNKSDERLKSRWRELLDTMGMTWLPGKSEWDKFHKQLKADQQHADQSHNKIDRRKAKSPKPRR